MKRLVIFGLFACSVVGLASSSRSQPITQEVPGIVSDDGITEHPSVPAPGDERPMKDPFTPYDVGDPSAAWAYEQLTPAEQVVADRGRATGTWTATHDAYGSAGAEQAARAAAESAALQLGVDNLGAIGVVP